MGQEEDWRRLEYKYERPEFLKSLVNMLDGNGIEVSVCLSNESFGEETQKEKNGFFNMDEKTLMENREAYKEFILKLKNKGIIPGWSLHFNSSFKHPEMEYTWMRHFSIRDDEELYATLIHPANFADGKWESIFFNDFKGEKNIRRLKESVRVFSENGYALVHVYATLNLEPYNPKYHYNGVDYSGTLEAGDGILSIMGYFPKDFDFSIFVPKELPEGQRD